MITAATLAATLAKLTRDPSRAPSMRTGLKRLAEMGVLKPIPDPADGRSTGLFSEAEACRARLVFALHDMGFPLTQIADLVAVSEGMEPGAVGELWDNGDRKPIYGSDADKKYRIENLPDAIARGEQWVLFCRLLDHGPGRSRTVSAHFRPVDHQQDAEQRERDTAWAKQLREIAGAELLGTIEVPASDLCRPIIQNWQWISK